MKLYIAGAYSARDHLRRLVPEFSVAGHLVTSSWLFETHAIRTGTIDAAPDQGPDYCETHVEGDIADIARADALVLFTTTAMLRLDVSLAGHTSSGGRHVETGVALALGKPVIIVGDPENIFHRASRVTVVNSVADAIDALDSLGREGHPVPQYATTKH